MKPSSSSSGALRLLLSQAINALGDHGAKIVSSALVASLFPEHRASVLVGLIAFLYVAPFLFFSSWAGRLSARWGALRATRYSLLFQAAALGVITLSGRFVWFPGVIVGIGLVATQSCVYGPVRDSLMRELAPSGSLGKWMSCLQLVGVGSLLTGMALGGWAYDLCLGIGASPWQSLVIIGGVACGLAMAAYVIVLTIRKPVEVQGERETSVSALASLKYLWVTKPIRAVTFGLAWFYGVGTLMVLAILQDGRSAYGQSAGAATISGSLSAALGLGVVIGSGLAAWFCRKRISGGPVFVGASGMAVTAFVAALVWNSGYETFVALIVLGVFGGLFSAPLNAKLIALADARCKASTMAASNVVINLVNCGFVGISTLLSVSGFDVGSQLALIGLSSIVALGAMVYFVPQALIRCVVWLLARVFYRFEAHGLRNLPTRGGVLITPNHVSFADAVFVYLASPRPVRFVGTTEMLRFPLIRWAYDRFGVIAIDPKNAKSAVTAVSRSLKAGEVVCLFPEGALTRTGMVMPFKKGVEMIARLSDAPIVPTHIDGLWGSVFSLQGRPFQLRRGMKLLRRVQVRFGREVPAMNCTAEGLANRVRALEAVSFEARTELKRGLGERALVSLKANAGKEIVVDRTAARKAFRGQDLAVASVAAKDWIERNVAEKRVGILLPPSFVGCVLNVAVAWAGKSSVNLNPTVSKNGVQHMITVAGVGRLITSRAVLAKLKDFDTSACNLLFVEDFFRRLSLLRKVLALGTFRLLPSKLFARVWGLSRARGESEATLLFSSGSSGTPKAIPLSHRNVAANIEQLTSSRLFQSSDTILSNLPFFHSFGTTGGLWLPLVRGLRMVTTPSPLLVSKNVDAIREEAVTFLLGTPTFLRGYLRKAKREDMASVRSVVAGAERLPDELSEAWEARFGIRILEGYGLTECSPVVCANCDASMELPGKDALKQRGSRAGAVGRPLVGVRLKIVRTGSLSEEVGPGESGLILVKAPNVFSGYIDEAENKERFVGDGWMNTGDIGRIDADGFLHIEGRLSRFSKIGGEMVPHGAIEDALVAFGKRLDLEKPAFVVMGRAHASKGEELVLLSSEAIDLKSAQAWLKTRGLPNLWLPQALIRVSEIPMLASGKIDLASCKRLALAKNDESAAA